MYVLCPNHFETCMKCVPADSWRTAKVCRRSWRRGPNSEINPVGLREHINPSYQGLRHIGGNGPYPIQDSFFVRSFGVGVRHRGAAAVCKITASTTYTPPTIAT